MTYEDRFSEAFLDMGLPIQPGLDTTAESEYVVYGYDSDGTLYGDDGPCLEYRRWTVVYVAPVAYDRRALRRKIREVIQTITGVWPSEDDATDGAGQRYIYEFETFGGIVDGAD
ncbi:MAG: hypothetical protein ACI3VZ_08220 [Faecousia sp.]